MLLADMDTEVVLLERAGAAEGATPELGKNAIVNRCRRSLALDLKDVRAVDAALCLIDTVDAPIESMRPGAMEPIGVRPKSCLARNPRLAYGRMTS